MDKRTPIPFLRSRPFFQSSWFKPIWVETNDQSLRPASVVYYPAGEPHDMRNATTEPARYLVFEFHAPPALAGHPRPPSNPLRREVTSADE